MLSKRAGTMALEKLIRVSMLSKSNILDEYSTLAASIYLISFLSNVDGELCDSLTLFDKFGEVELNPRDLG